MHLTTALFVVMLKLISHLVIMHNAATKLSLIAVLEISGAGAQ